MVGFLIALTLLLALFLFLIFPAVRRHPARQKMQNMRIAHRGLHDDTLPENSLAAFQAACEAGYAIENDIHITKDGQVVVFHDDTLNRVCGVEGKIEDLTLAQIKQLRLLGTEHTIPTLQECLDLVAGRVPLLIEFKCLNVATCHRLCAAADKILQGYGGEYYIQSFYPFVLRWYRKHRKAVCRGQLASGFYKEDISKRLLGCMLFNFLARPDFISYEYTCRKNLFRRLCGILGAFPVGWTFRSQADIDRCRKDFKAYIFENFKAK